VQKAGTYAAHLTKHDTKQSNKRIEFWCAGTSPVPTNIIDLDVEFQNIKLVLIFYASFEI